MGRRHHGGLALNGWLAIHKESGMTSTRVVEQVRSILRANKAGHGGTLDPFAEGLLPVAMGSATKTLGLVLEGDKSYQCWVRFGLETDTDDCTGKPLWETGNYPTLEDLQAVLPEFTGTIQQVPPIYSAIRVDGDRAYHLARRGEVLDLPARTVHIHRLELVDYVEGLACFHIDSSKGTYIRALARDLGRKLGTAGHLQKLIRTRTLGFTLQQAVTLDQLRQEAAGDGWRQWMFPVDRVLDGIPALRLENMAWNQAQNGQTV
ncbi:MAG: tRNA pseudouridine(55) synthase TruB, partial [Magnetococcales bacterium]|nr:tRNA pseudouridine(55) synthase TruB [Magnetococcales bacterium]